MSDKDSRILQFPQVCIVEASAGSGKTFALAKRYLQLLINPALTLQEIPLRNILAITFSNKATIEMKERILEYLKKIALDQFSNTREKGEIFSDLRVEEATAQKKALLILDVLFRNYNFFQIQTIDSFINAILSACAFRLDLSANFRIKTDPGDYLAYGLDKLIDRAATDKTVAQAFANFLKQYLYLENRTGWFPKKNILSVMSDLFSRANHLGGIFLVTPISVGDVVSLKKQILSHMRQLAKMLPEGVHRGFAKSLSAFLEVNQSIFSINDVSDYFAREEFPSNKGTPVSSKVGKLWKKIKEGLQVVAEAESASAFNAYIELYKNVFNEFKALSHKEDILFLDELNCQARILFDEKAMTAPELYYRLAMRLKHFLIDEFQDTSRLQWQNLAPMVKEALSVGGSLFYVGDKKQAIYRFRGGDVSLFGALQERFRDFNLIFRSLNHNYRSQKEIVQFSNAVFSPENLKRFLEAQEGEMNLSVSDKEAVYKIFEEAEQIPMPGKDKGYLRLEVVEARSKDERDALIREKLHGLTAGLSSRFDYADIAFLVRTNDEVELLTEWFVEKGIPVESENTLDIRNNRVIKELVSLLKFLNAPIDNLSFVSFIFGDIFSKVSGLGREELHDFVFKLREKNRQEKGVYLYREFRQRYPRVWEATLEDFFKNVGFMPLYELIVSILGRFNCLRDFGDDQAFVMRFLELIKEQEEERANLSLFLEFFDKGEGEDFYVKVSLARAVKVLTIHKSKGLEFPVVVLPFLEIDVSVGSLIALQDDGHLMLRRINEKYRKFSKTLEALYQQEYLKFFIDELDTIYVAITRAKDELHIFLPGTGKSVPAAAQFLTRDQCYERGKPAEFKKSAAETIVASEELAPSHYADWIQFLKDEFRDAGSVMRRKHILRGEVLHDILSRVGNLWHCDKELLLKEAVAKTKFKFPFSKDLKTEEASLRKLLDEGHLNLFFYCPEAEVFQEKEVVDGEGRTKRIDRLIVSKSEAWIVDYKSTYERDEENKAQVREYISLLSGVYPTKKVRGFLIYLDTLTSEEVA